MSNIREVVLATETWEEGQDGSSELNKILLPILSASLNFDIQEAAEKASAAVKSGVSNQESFGEEGTIGTCCYFASNTR